MPWPLAAIPLLLALPGEQEIQTTFPPEKETLDRPGFRRGPMV
jgi:hypothetical protein